MKCHSCRKESTHTIGVPVCKECRTAIENHCPHRVVLIRCRHPEQGPQACNEDVCPEKK